MFPTAKVEPVASTQPQQKTTVITDKIDTDTLKKVKSYKDYGVSTLDNVGRVNPFGPLE